MPQPSSFPLGLSPNFSCRIAALDTLTQVGNFASATVLSKTETLSGLGTLSSDFMKFDFATCRKVVNLSSVQNLLLFLQDYAESFLETPPQYNPKGVWTSFCKILSGTAMALQPLTMDALGSGCRMQVKLHCNILPFYSHSWWMHGKQWRP